MQNDKERALEHEFAARTNDLHRHAGERIDAVRVAAQAICRHAHAGVCPCREHRSECQALMLFGITQTIAVRALDQAGFIRPTTPPAADGAARPDYVVPHPFWMAMSIALIGLRPSLAATIPFADRRPAPWWRRAFDFLADALALTELTDKEPADAVRMYRALLSEKDAAVKPADGVDMRGPLGAGAARHEAGAQDQESGLPAGREHGAARGPRVGDGESGSDRTCIRPAVVDHLPIPYWWAL